MNRGFLESLPVQQLMMNLNPNWWNINNMMKPPPPPSPHQDQHHQQPSPPHLLPSLYPPPSSATSSSPLPPSLLAVASSWHHESHHDHHLPESWSQLLLGGSVGEEDRSSGDGTLSTNYHQQPAVKQEVVVLSENSASYLFHSLEDQLNRQQAPSAPRTTSSNWSNNQQVMPTAATSPISCVSTTSFTNNMLDFSNRKSSEGSCKNHQPPDLSPHECNSTTTATGGSFKKARVQPAACSTISTFKVRKEKLGDRITALHQLVSPFGKTDTASVLLEAIGYIRFLHNQIEALSSPYLGNGSGNMRNQQLSVQGEKNSMFPEDPGQLLNDPSCIKRRVPNQVMQDHPEAEAMKDLRSRGLCLVPVSCTMQVGSDNGADYWAPALGGGFR